MKRSVTQVLDYSIPPQLAKWFKNNSAAKCDKIGEETSRIGSYVDQLVQQDIREGGYLPPEDDQQVLNCLAGWEKLKRDHPLFVGSVKEMQVELIHGELVGHPDFVCVEEDGSWGISDLKCTSGIRFKNYIQCATYARMLMGIRKWEPFSFIRVIRLKRDSSDYEWSEIREPEMLQYFVNLFDHYDAIFLSEGFLKEYFRTQLEEQLLGDW